MQNTYNQQQVKWERQDFFVTLCTWKSKAYVVKKSGHVLGYLVKNRYGADISEIVVPAQELIAVTTAWIIKNKKDSVKVSVSPYDQLTNDELILHSENYCQTNVENWLILDYQCVIKTLLQYKVRCQRVISGKSILQIDDAKYQISVQDDKVEVTSSSEQADLVVDRGEATRLLFGVKVGRCDNAWLDSILPLPVYVSSIDRV